MLSFIENKTMTTVSYTTLLFNWFRLHFPFSQKSTKTSIPRTGYAGAYPTIKQCHRRQSHLLSCIPLLGKSKTNINRSKIEKSNSSIRGCASFARFDRYREGDVDDDC